MIAKLLIANRGEIACRVIQTARRRGVATVAVYSDADVDALHVRMADEAVRIGAAAASESYLNIDAILNAARKTGADTVHPGYGFLSENTAFAEACAAAGVTFVGPPAAAIRAMGDKARAKALMREAGVPVVPGYDGNDQSPDVLAAEAQRTGFPLLVKAVAGGGGRGMRRVADADELPAALESARREAENAFGDGKLLLERLVEDARHIEIQVFGDSHGNVIHLGERDCSTQRRHQKIIEEAPSPFVDAAMRDAMGAAATEAARAVAYGGAGTVEFIVAPDRSFFFLEMNTRLQVEHPVTEMITGLDLVEWQLRVAAGEPLPLTQEAVSFSGHAIEARLCAEDTAAGFVPQTGKVLHWRPHRSEMDGVRLDHGLVEGVDVTPFYDPMVAKFIVHGENRDVALAKLERVLRTTPLLGVATNRAFLLDILRGDVFRQAGMTTNFVDALTIERHEPDDADFAAAAVILSTADGDDWFSSTGLARCPVTLRCGDIERSCTVVFERGRLAGVDAAGVRYPADLAKTVFARDGNSLWLDRDGVALAFEEPDLLKREGIASDGRFVVSPVSGMLRHLVVGEGDMVQAGDAVAIVEAMKMETQLVAGCDGSIMSIRARSGEQVRAGDIVVEIAGAP